MEMGNSFESVGMLCSRLSHATAHSNRGRQLVVTGAW